MNWKDEAGKVVAAVTTMSQKVLDDSGKENMAAASSAGLETHVIRSYDDVGLHDGKDECEWCKSREGDWGYRDAIRNGVFERHPGCECTIDYVTEKGTQRQTNWQSNTWQDVQDPETLKTRQRYGTAENNVSPLERIRASQKEDPQRMEPYYRTANMSADEYARAKDMWRKFEEVDMSAAEKAHITEEFDNNLSAEEKEFALVHRPIGNYYYHAVNMGHGQYKVYKKEPIEPYDDVVDEVLSEMFGRDWKRQWEEIKKSRDSL